MNINLFQMFAGPKMGQGLDGAVSAANQTGQATGDFAGLLQAFLFGNAAGMQTVDGQQAGLVNFFDSADNGSSSALQMITDSLKDGILSQQELMNIIQTTLTQFPLLTEGFMSRIGDIFSSAMPVEQADELLAGLRQMLNVNNGMNANSNQPVSSAYLSEAVDSQLTNSASASDLSAAKQNNITANADKTTLPKTEAQPKDMMSATSTKGLSPEEFIDQIASKIAEHKMQNQAASFESPVKMAFAMNTGDEIFGQIVSSVAKASEHGNDESADALKAAADIKFTPASGSANINASSSLSAVKETIHISNIQDIDQIMAKMANSGQQKLVLRIDPPELGSIQIRLVLDNGVIRADFRVDSQAVKDSFNFAMPLIKTSLEDAGIKTGEFFVDLKEDYYSDRKQGQERSGQNKNENGQKEDNSFFELFA